MISEYIPPKRWYRRQHEIRVTVWPTWLAQLLCPHAETSPVLWNQDGSVDMLSCHECYKWIQATVSDKKTEVKGE